MSAPLFSRRGWRSCYYEHLSSHRHSGRVVRERLKRIREFRLYILVSQTVTRSESGSRRGTPLPVRWSEANLNQPHRSRCHSTEGIQMTVSTRHTAAAPTQLRDTRSITRSITKSIIESIFVKKFIKRVSLNASVLSLLRVYTTVTVISVTGTVAYTLNSKDRMISLRDTQSIISKSHTRLFCHLNPYSNCPYTLNFERRRRCELRELQNYEFLVALLDKIDGRRHQTSNLSDSR